MWPRRSEPTFQNSVEHLASPTRWLTEPLAQSQRQHFGPSGRRGKIPSHHSRSRRGELSHDWPMLRVLLRYSCLTPLVHVPDHDMVVGHVHTGMASVEVHGHMIVPAREPRKVELLPV